MKNIILIIVILILVVCGFYLIFKFSAEDEIDGIDFNQGRVQNQEAESPADTSDANNPNQEITELTAEIMKQGTGEEAKNGDQATVHYIGVLEDGTKFDSSVDREEPFTFTIGAGQVIVGWDLGLVGMKVGEIRRLYIPSEYGYGERGTPNGSIPPNTNLIFEVQLLGLNL